MLDLFAVSAVSEAAGADAAADIWRETIDHPGTTVFVSDGSGCIAATCMLITAPNLLRQGRRHAYLDNVVTRPACQGQGHGRAVVEAALAHAWERNCHHVMLQSGRPEPRTHRFYEQLGFVPGLRTAYVAMRPTR